MTRRARRVAFAAVVLIGIGIAACALFPGQRLGLAFTIGTGIGTPSLQRRIDELEQKAIDHGEFSPEDRAFLGDFYATLATGAKFTLLVRQTGRLMSHYLEGSGSDYQLEPSIFIENARVRAEMSALRRRVASTACDSGIVVASGTFYMPDASKIDSVFGLYHGSLQASRASGAGGVCRVRFRAEVPWTWPSYVSLKQKYGNYHAESFPLPNLRALLFGREHALYVDNGLGEYLAELGLAKPFLAFAEWEDVPP